MSVLLLVRHGQASWDAADYDQLSGLGEEQSRLLGSALAGRGVRPTVLVAGDMKRHEQTCGAAREAAGWDVPVVVDPGWNEFDHLQMLAVHEPPQTAAAQMSKAEFQAWFEAATRRWLSGDFDEQYDESFGAFSARVDAALRRTVERLGSGDSAVVFTSGGPLSWVAAALLGGGTTTWEQLNPVTVNTGVTKVVAGRRGLTLVTVNEHSHLEPDRITYR